MARYTLLEGLRNRFFWLLGALLGSGVLVALFAGQLAVSEIRETQGALLGGFLRLAAVLLIALLVLTIQLRELHDKGLELLLSLPISRSSYFFGKFLGFSLLALPVSLLCGLLVFSCATPEGAATWALSLYCELLITIALSQLCLLSFEQLPAAFGAVLAIYLFSRILTGLLQISRGPIMPQEGWMQTGLETALSGMAFLLPDLERFTRAEWLAYGAPDWGAMGFVLGQTGVCLLLLWGSALFDLYRKSL
ncbi:MAG: ABC transporter permease [Magnetococcus sp. MYC-9]